MVNLEDKGNSQTSQWVDNGIISQALGNVGGEGRNTPLDMLRVLHGTITLRFQVRSGVCRSVLRSMVLDGDSSWKPLEYLGN